MEEIYFETDPEKKRGLLLDNYKGKFSLVQAREKDGKIYKDWCYPQYDRRPKEKAVPFGARIGGGALTRSALEFFLSQFSPKEREPEDMPF